MRKLTWIVLFGIAALCGGRHLSPRRVAEPQQGVAANHIAARTRAAAPRRAAAYGRLPLSFEVNQGQMPDPVKFRSRGRGYNLALLPTEAVLALGAAHGPATHGPKPATLHMKLVGANAGAQVSGVDELPGKVDRTRELVALHADQADQCPAAIPADVAHDAIHSYARIGLVERLDDDLDVGPQHLPAPAIVAQPIKGSQRVGRNMRPQPSDGIAGIVVMRRLDQDELETSLLGRTAHCGLLPLKVRALSNRAADDPSN